MRSLRELLRAMQISPEERQQCCCERSLEALYEDHPAHPLGEGWVGPISAIEAERRRIDHASPAMSGTKRTSS